MVSEPSPEIPNPALPWAILGMGQVVAGAWAVLVVAMALYYQDDPLEGWANLPSRIVTVLGILWLLGGAIGGGYMLSYANAPPTLRIGRDYVEGSPPRRYYAIGGPTHLRIRFDEIRSIGWTGVGPAVLTDRRGPLGFGFIVSYPNAKILRERLGAWKVDLQ